MCTRTGQQFHGAKKRQPIMKGDRVEARRSEKVRENAARKRGRLYSEARQEVGVRWNSAKVGELDQRWKSPITITSFRL